MQGSVDCASILENKERLRLFWERRIMAEQENVVASTTGETTTASEGSEIAEVSPPDSLNEEPEHIEEPLQESAGIKSPTNMPEEEESALDFEVRMSLEREQQLKKEQADRQLDTAKETEVDTEKLNQLTKSEEVAVLEQESKNVQVEKETISKSDGICTEIKDPSIVEKKHIVVDSSSEVAVGIEQASVETEAGKQPPSQVDVTKEPKCENANPKATSDTASEPAPAKTDADSSVVKPQIVGETYHLVNESSEDAIVSGPLVSPVQSSVRPTALPTPKGDRPLFNPGADSKIAREIQEMKAREEELKKMRESLQQQQQNGLKMPNGSSRLSENGSVHSDDGHGPSGRASPPPRLIEEKHNGIVNGQHGLDTLQDQTVYNVGYAFGHRRKDGIKVKPLSDEPDGDYVKTEEIIEKSSFPVLKESPIEREIRLSREREEELRKEKGMLQSPVIEGDVTSKRPSSLNLNGGRSVRNQVNGTKVAPPTDTQRFLATNRIQQEIVEQTEREMALRASGKIQTISQERTDAKVTRLRDMTSPAEMRALQFSSSPPASPALSSSASDSDKSNGISNGHHLNGSAKTPSPSNSTVSGGQIQVSNGSAGRRFSNPPPVRGVSMQRFIASKGRELSFTAFNAKNKEKSNSVLSLHSEPFKSPKEGTRPLGTPPGQTNGRRCVPAETKIQEELKEMQAREDELRQQRARLLGLSQPNLSTLSGDEDLHVNNGHYTDVVLRKGQDGLDRASSNPNLLDEEQYDDDENEKISVGGPRRRSMLIDQWEKRIQKTDVVKA